ncbi:MAG: hypothetical protein KAS32_20055 [Candidatus Peribacteraceae bacterium]|nr:hypothetical protein [Candidatus Peribacteraceae bacterium]
MSYRHIENLYKDQKVLMFKRLYALEKIHGTSSRVFWSKGQLHLSPGGCKIATFEKIFNQDDLRERFIKLGHDSVIVYGEQYGGKRMRMSNTYGKEAKFVAFEVKIGDAWLSVLNAADVAHKLGLEFVHYNEIPAEMEAIDSERDADSIQAIRNGMGTGKEREGVVLRPLIEMRDNRGQRVMAKHKADSFIETATPRKVSDPLKVLEGERAALEWVTDMRLEHVLDKILGDKVISITGVVVRAMLEDITREGSGEVLMEKETKKAISKATADKYHNWLKRQ